MKHLTLIIAACAVFCAMAASTADDIARYESGGQLAADPSEVPVDAPKDMKLILCIGQSNMAGRAKPMDEDHAVVTNAYKLNRDLKWVAAKSPYHFDRNYAAVGPVDDFVKLYLKDHPGESIGVVPCAVGGSPLSSWTPAAKGRRGANLRVALERAKAAKANGKFIAILWHQGETDAAKATSEQLAEYYPRDFKAMVEAVRKEIGDVPVIAGEIGRWMRRDGDHAAKINPVIDALPKTVPNCAVASSEGLKNQDAHHFDRASQHVLATRYYEAFKRCGDRIEVDSRCLRLNGKPIVPIMGEMHYSRVPREEWARSLRLMKEGGVSIVSMYVIWNHHEWREGEYDFSGNRDLSAFLAEVEKAGLWAIVRIGPWAHGEVREGGFPDWLIEKFRLNDRGDGKWRRRLRSCDREFLAETGKYWRRVFTEVSPHLWKNGGAVVGVQLENESRGPWPYYQALKALAVEIGYDVPLFTRTGWPRINGGETTFGEMIPLYGDYAEGFWDRSLKSMPGDYKKAFEMRPARTSSVIATDILGSQKAEDAKGANRYPYFTCELGGGMASSYHRRLNMEPMDAFALAVVKLGSGSNLLGFYMYHGGANPTDIGANMAESQRGLFTNHNDLPRVSYEFQAPISEFGEPQKAYWHIQALARFCRAYGEEFATEDPVFVSRHETRRGRFVFHNDYVRRLNPNGECWIGVEKDGKIEKIVEMGRCGNEEAAKCAHEKLRFSVSGLKLLKPAGTPPAVSIGTNGVAQTPDEEAWDAAAEYEVPAERRDAILEISYDGDMARLYADGRLVQDDFWKGVPIRYALWRLPKDAKKLTLKVLPWGEGVREKVFIDLPPCARGHSFEIGEKDFLLDGKPFVIHCGEVHYARIPRPYWRHRLKMLRAMGMNAVGCYMFWNYHEREPGKFNWEGAADAAAFCRMAQEEGLWVVLRPGPYACAEWEGGGAPWWLMADDTANGTKPISMRSSDPRWLEPAKRWIQEVGRQLAPLQVTRGGPILMVQVENEYGLHGNDANYIRALRQATIDAGFEVPLYACNPPRVIENGFVPELFQAANFGAEPAQRFEIVRKHQPKGPLMCSEYYPAWFDTWGQAHHPPKGDRQFFGPIDWMLENGASFSLYMAHGGTSFGGWSGCRNPFVPNVTSYDYEAPISEQGRANPSFAKMAERLGKHLNTGESVGTMPEPIPVKDYGSIILRRTASVDALCTREVKIDSPVFMEQLGQGFGLVSYETYVPAEIGGDIRIGDIHDFGYVFLDGKRLGTLDRRHRGIKVHVPRGKDGMARKLQILVEPMGRINSSSGMEDRKGLNGPIRLDRTSLTGWIARMMPIDPDGQKDGFLPVGGLSSGEADAPALYSGELEVADDVPADTFLDMSSWRKGIAWVNGHNLGRFWCIGPQQTLYVPGCWLRKGMNTVVVLDFFGPGGNGGVVAFRAKPILDVLRTDLDFNSKKRSSSELLGGELAASGTFPQDDAAQVAMFEKPVRGNVFTFVADSVYDAKNLAAIAEFDFLDKDGNPLTSLGLSVSGVDSEEEIREDGVAENAIDGQVEAAWITSSRTLPHWIEFSSGSKVEVFGFRCTPRQSGSMGRVKEWRFYAR